MLGAFKQATFFFELVAQQYKRTTLCCLAQTWINHGPHTSPPFAGNRNEEQWLID